MDKEAEPQTPPADEHVPSEESIDVYGRMMTPGEVLAHAKRNCKTCAGRGVVVKAKKGKMCHCVQRELVRRYAPKQEDIPEIPPEPPKPATPWQRAKTARLEGEIASLEAKVAAAKKLDDDACEAAQRNVDVGLGNIENREQQLNYEMAEVDKLKRSIDSLQDVINERRAQLLATRDRADSWEVMLVHGRGELTIAKAELAAVKEPRKKLLVSLAGKVDKAKRRLDSHHWRHQEAAVIPAEEKTEQTS